ncbi:MAG: hypothetical protein WCH11_05795, partial [Bdellovibrio sp.]
IDHFSGEKMDRFGSVLGAAYTAGLLAQAWARQKFVSPEDAIRDLKTHLYSVSQARQWTGSSKILMGQSNWLSLFGWSDLGSQNPTHWQSQELRHWFPNLLFGSEQRLEKETEIWIEVPGARELALHFRDFHHFSIPQTPDSDRVEIYDEQYRLLFQLSGEFKELVTPILPTSRLRILVISPHAADSSHVRGFELWRIYFRF